MNPLILVAVSACVFTIIVFKWLFVGRKTPPGPWGLPLIGYLPFLSRKAHLDFYGLSKKYGAVFSIRLGTTYVVVLNNFRSLKEAFAQDAFVRLPEEFPAELNKETIERGAFLDLPWKDVRRFALHTFKDLGLGKTKMEKHIQEEITCLLERFEQNTDKPFCIRDFLAPSMSNNIASLVFGKQFSFDNPLREMMNRGVEEAISSAEQTGWQIFFPYLGKIAKFLGIVKVHKSSKDIMELRNYAWKEIEEHEKTFNPNNIRDFIDRFLYEMQKGDGNPLFTKRILQDLVYIFFVAGSHTVRVTVEWLVLTVAAHQDVQRRIQNEIDKIIGRNRLPERIDYKEMPFTEAFIMEVMRWKPIGPFAFIRYTLTDTEVYGFHIPKRTLIIPNLWAIHHDSEYWGKDVEEFRPDRFLTEDGKVLKCDQLIPFSIGKRSCPGEPLAKVEVFLYFVSLLQRFNIRLPEGKVADFEEVVSNSLAPKLQDIVLTGRE